MVSECCKTNNREGGGVGAPEHCQTATGEVGRGTQGSMGKLLTAKIPLGVMFPGLITLYFQTKPHCTLFSSKTIRRKKKKTIILML